MNKDLQGMIKKPMNSDKEETQVLEMVPFEQQDDDLKKKLAKNNESKMVLYNSLTKTEYERILICKMAKIFGNQFNKSEFSLATYIRGLASVKGKLVFYKKNEVLFYEQIDVLKRDISYKDSDISVLKSELEKLKKEKESNQLKIENFDTASKSVDKLIGSQIPDKCKKGLGYESYHAVPPSLTGLFSPPKLDLSNSVPEEFQQHEFEGYGPKTSKSVYEDISNEVKENHDALLVKDMVLDNKDYSVESLVVVEKKLLFLLLLKLKLLDQNNKKNQLGKQLAQSTVKRTYQQRTALTNKSFSQTVNTARPRLVNTTRPRPVNTARPRPVNSSRPNSAVVNAVRVNQFNVVKASMNLMEDTLPLGEEPKEEELLVKELLKLVLLKVSRRNNMYSADIKNIVPKESLTCLVAKATFDESMLWHKRLGHINFKNINKLVKDNLVRGLPSKRFENDQTCVACLKGKPHKASSSKDETSGILKKFITEIENLVDKKVKIIRYDNETEFKNSVMNDFYATKGIIREFSVARTPQQNGVAKRRNRILIEAARTLLTNFKLPITFWPKAVNTACYVQNRVLVVKPHNKTIYYLFKGRTPALSFMRPFGCHVTILNTLDHLEKFDEKSNDGFFVGYSLNSKAFRVYNLRTRKVEENLHIRFLEDKPSIASTQESTGEGHSSKEKGSSQDYILMPLWKDGSLFDFSLKNASNDEPQPSSDAGHKDDEGVSKESKIDNQEKPKNSTKDVTTVEPSINDASTNDNTELDLSNISNIYLVPSTPNTRIHKDHSLDHIIDDVQSGVLTRRMTKTTTDQGFISVVYEGKTHEDLHTCLFACFLSQEEPKKGYTQEEDIDYDEVFAHVTRIEAIRLFLAYASFMEFMVYQIDVKSAFLYGRIEEEVYVCQPLGFEDLDHPDKVYKVVKVLYVLHQDPRAWYETLAKYLLGNGFHNGKIDQTLFIKRQKGDILLVHVYVDDIIFGFTKKELCIKFERQMKDKFQMSFMGELTFFLGLQVTQKNDGIFISQDKYVSEILKKFGFLTVKTTSTPIETSKPLLNDAEAEDIDVHLYRSLIGSLMYLTASRPDIMFVVCAYARFQVTPKVSHLHAMKRIFKYLKGQSKLGLWYPKDSPLELEAYTDNDYDGASLYRKSTIRGCQFFRSRLISWQYKKQTVVANSTTEAEYVAAASCCGQVLWIQNQMLDYGYNFMNTKIFIDNESTICIVKNLVFHSKTKYIEIQHYFIRDSNEKKLIQMNKIHTDQNVADLLTKAFDVGRCQYLVASIGILNL
nr:putative ribonuclease H-like domain-containing protein [Tanacetum cinerariifolium]